MSDSIDIEEEEKKSNKEPKEEINAEDDHSKNQYQIIQNQDSNIITNQIVQLLQEKLLYPIDNFNVDLLKKYDTEGMFDKETLEQIESELDKFKQSYIEDQFKTIKKIISDYNLVENAQNLSEEKTFAEELNSFDIKSDILSFIGPLSEKIKEMNNKEQNKDGNDIKDNSYEIEKDLFQLVQINYYNNKIMSLEESIKTLDYQIEDLKNKNKII
jgi:hypothetical protein